MYQKQNQKNHEKLDEKEILKNLKMNFFFFNKENSRALQETNVMVDTCWGISNVIYKKKQSQNDFF